MNGWRTLSLLWLFKLLPSLLFAAPPPPGGKSLSIADPNSGGTTTWTNNPDDVDKGFRRTMSVGMRITVPRSETPQNLLTALEAGGKVAWLAVVDYWLSEKMAMIQEFAGKGNQLDADRVASTMIPLKIDRHLYSLGMRPPDEYCHGVIPWWWENCSKEQWEEGGQLDFFWQALGWQAYDPYREFTPSTTPDVSTDVGVATSFYQFLDRRDWAEAQRLIASGIGELDLGAMYFGRSVEGTDSFEFLPFSRFPNPVYEILARAEYTVDGQTYSNLVLQRRWSETDPARTAGIKTWLGMKRVDGTWKISNAFRGSSGEKILNRAVGSGWYGLDSVWEVNDQGVYRYQVGRRLIEMPFSDSTIYNTIWKPFVNPTLRKSP